MLHTNLSIDPATGHLLLAGRDTVELAEKYGTPLYLLDEARIREKCRTYVNAMKEAFAPGIHAAFGFQGTVLQRNLQDCRRRTNGNRSGFSRRIIYGTRRRV